MITLDSIRMQIPKRDASVEEQFFLTQELYKHSGDLLASNQILDSQHNTICGLKTSSMNSEFVFVEVSAKILKDDYLKGICLDTVDRLADTLKPIVNITSFDNAQLLRLDCTKNLHVDNVKNSISALKLGKSNTGFKVDDYATSKNNGIVFTGRQVSYKNRQIYYNKQVEMSLPRNKDFLSSLAHQTKFYKELSPILRVEQNITSKSRIRKCFGTIETNLMSVLKSKQAPLSKRHDTIMKFANEIKLFDTIDMFENIADFILAMGFKGIIAGSNNSLELAEDVLKSRIGQQGFAKATVYRYIKKLKELANMSFDKTENDGKYYKELLNINKALNEAEGI